MAGLYIYYRVDPARQPALVAELKRIQGELAADFALSARLMRKADDPATLMEVYEALRDGDALLAALNARLTAIGFDTWLMPGSRRHVERFECA